MYLVSYRRKLTCTCVTCADLRGWSNTLLVYVVNFKRKKKDIRYLEYGTNGIKGTLNINKMLIIYRYNTNLHIIAHFAAQ